MEDIIPTFENIADEEETVKRILIEIKRGEYTGGTSGIDPKDVVKYAIEKYITMGKLKREKFDRMYGFLAPSRTVLPMPDFDGFTFAEIKNVIELLIKDDSDKSIQQVLESIKRDRLSDVIYSAEYGRLLRILILLMRKYTPTTTTNVLKFIHLTFELLFDAWPTNSNAEDKEKLTSTIVFLFAEFKRWRPTWTDHQLNGIAKSYLFDLKKKLERRLENDEEDTDRIEQILAIAEEIKSKLFPNDSQSDAREILIRVMESEYPSFETVGEIVQDIDKDREDEEKDAREYDEFIASLGSSSSRPPTYEERRARNIRELEERDNETRQSYGLPIQRLGEKRPREEGKEGLKRGFIYRMFYYFC